jgi:hypothetical protein
VDLSYKTKNIFPISIHSITVNDFHEVKNTLVEDCYNWRKNDPRGRQVSNQNGGWQSQYQPLKNMNPILDSTIATSLMTYLPIRKNIPFSVGGWLNINPPGAYNRMHSHPDCHLSGVFWIKSPDKSGNIIFEHPNSFNSFVENLAYSTKFKLENNTDHLYSCIPVEGKIMIFPSYLNHEVSINESDEDRISYAFNIKFNLRDK